MSLAMMRLIVTSLLVSVDTLMFDSFGLTKKRQVIRRLPAQLGGMLTVIGIRSYQTDHQHDAIQARTSSH